MSRSTIRRAVAGLTAVENTLRLTAEGLGLTSYPGAAANASNMGEFFNP
jgi:hypothetical protein